MHKCYNDKTKNIRRSSKTPLGIGYSANAEEEGTKIRGKDGRVWVVRKNRWMITRHQKGFDRAEKKFIKMLEGGIIDFKYISVQQQLETLPNWFNFFDEQNEPVFPDYSVKFLYDCNAEGFLGDYEDFTSLVDVELCKSGYESYYFTYVGLSGTTNHKQDDNTLVFTINYELNEDLNCYRVEDKYLDQAEKESLAIIKKIIYKYPEDTKLQTYLTDRYNIEVL